MLSPRFMFLATSMPGPGGSGRSVAVHLWRLVAGNNRVLGCGPVTYPDDEASRAAVARLLRDLPSAVPEPGLQSRPGRWRWQLVLPTPLDAAPDLDAPQRLLAVSGRSYERQRSSRDNVEQFLAAAPVATVSTALVVRPRPRPWSSLDGTGLVPQQTGATPPLVTDHR